MDLNAPVSSPSKTGPEPSGASSSAGGKMLPDHPPKEWTAAMARKYGPMPISDNARTVLERRYLKKGGGGEQLETPEEMLARVAYNIALAEGRFYGGIPEVGLRWAEAFYAAMTRMEFLRNSPTLMNAGR